MRRPGWTPSQAGAEDRFGLRPWHYLVALAAIAAFAAWRVVANSWLCDDSFISLRYVQNLLDGQGLVYNPGERVEGYTSLLWVLSVAGLARLGVTPEVASSVLGAASYAILALVLALRWWSRRATRLVFPVAAGLVLGLSDFHVWATGGLETATFALLALGGLLLACRRQPSVASDLAASALFGLTVLTRPDGLLFLGMAVARPWWGERGAPLAARARRSALLLAPAAALVAGQVMFKLEYYGDLLPTAYYSKSALRPYYSQGALYAGLWCLKNWAVLPVALFAWLVGWKRAGTDPWRAEAVFLSVSGLLYVLYVMHSGGDFMFARRLIPALPLLFCGLEFAIGTLGEGWAPRALLGILLLGVLLPIPLFGPARMRISGVADEPRFYPASVRNLRRQQGEVIGSLLSGTPARVMFEGGMCSFGYYSRLPYLIEMTGLTQYSLAKLPLSARGRVGHEKQPTPEWLSENDVHLAVTHDDPPFRPGPDGPELDQIYFGWLARARIVRYSDAVMDALRNRPGVVFVPIEQLLAAARKDIRAADLQSAQSIYRFLDNYYFRSGGPRAVAAAGEFQALLRGKERR